MDATDFRRIALSLPRVEEASHMGQPDFRVDGRIFATLAAASLGYGNLKLTLELQAEFLAERPDLYLPIAGGWGRMGMTHIRLDAANEEELTGSMRAAYNLRVAPTARKSNKKSMSGGKKSTK